ncbi:hypothetical protein [Paraburkholderia gardini]|uniref:PXPV repeat-containing protein n=1 Tax=Paraburkholderia gardini TaxID=2823469 RepID=A0ABM8U3F2_9BURK|nr:hypothetical protein [Paraburkholderia gardini]CAG4898510.1 hypothetical protein R54767_02399 [Paraburkholderia gardini]
MKTLNRTTRTVIATLLAGGALLTAGSAFAQYAPMVRHDGPPAAAYGQPHMIPVGVSISIGWHGDRYYDGHRYWQHDEWMRHHPHDYDPHHHDEHRSPQHY